MNIRLPAEQNCAQDFARWCRFAGLIVASTLQLVLSVDSLCAQSSASRGVANQSRLSPMRVRIDGLPPSAPLVRVLIQIEATGEQTPRSLPAGVVRSILVPAGLVTITGDTIVAQRDSTGPTIYVPVETGQLTLPDSGIAILKYAPITGSVEIRVEGGPPGLSATVTTQHSCVQISRCTEQRGSTTANPGGDVLGIAGSVVRVAPAVAGVWLVWTRPESMPLDAADGSSQWCPSPTSTNFTVVPGRVSTVMIRFVKRRSCS